MAMMRLVLPPTSQSQRRASPAPGVQGYKQLQCPGQRRRSRRVPLRQPQRERVEHDVDRARRVGTGRRGPGGLGRLPHAARPLQIAGHQRGSERIQVHLAGQAGIERLKQPGRAQQQPGCVAAAVLVRRDLAAQALHLRGLVRVQRSGLGRDQQPQRRIRLPGLAFGPGRGQQPLRPAAGLGGQQRRPLQERGRRGQPPAVLRPACRPLQLRRDLLIRPRRGLRPVPGPPIRISRRIGNLCQRPVHLLPLPR
jgi:hypothetical protein